jgi:ABC-type nickel/cobalt efflux system permease component RcnA
VATDGPRPAEGPQPGDPRATGPRPRARAADLAWVGLATALVAITAVQFVMLFATLFRMETRLSGGARLLGFAFTVLWLLTVSWFALGAWRRSVWGCPFDHVTTAPAERICPRHDAVPDPEHDQAHDQAHEPRHGPGQGPGRGPG